jgi:hypothetical protein
MLIKAKREEDKSGALFYSSILLLLFSLSAWCRSWTLSLFFPAPHSPSALPCLHCSREQWRHGSAEEEEVKKKLRASSYWKQKKKLRASGYCAVTQFAKKAAPSCFFSPCVCNAENNGAYEQ